MLRLISHPSDLERNSVEDLCEDTNKLHGNATCLSELRNWHEDRLFPSGHGKQLDEDDLAGEMDDQGNEEKEHKRKKGGGARNGQVDPMFAELLESAQASSLQILK